MNKEGEGNMNKIFEHPNISNFCCPICHGDDDRPIVLITIQGTQKKNIIEAKQVHLDCLLDGLEYYKDIFAIAIPTVC